MQLSTTIDAPPEAVFAAASDFPHAPDMIAGIDKIEMLSEANDGSPIGVGTRFRETRTMFGKQAVETMEVTEYDPPRAYTLTALSCGVRFDSRVEVAPAQPDHDDGSSRLSYDVQGTPTTLTARVVGAITGPMMKGTMRKAMEKDLADMKAHLEGATVADSPPDQHA